MKDIPCRKFLTVHFWSLQRFMIKPHRRLPVEYRDINSSPVPRFMMDYFIVMFSQESRSEKLCQHCPALDLRQSDQIRKVSISVAHPHYALGHSITFRLKPLLCPVPASERRKFPIRISFSLIHMIKEILKIPESNNKLIFLLTVHIYRKGKKQYQNTIYPFHDLIYDNKSDKYGREFVKSLSKKEKLGVNLRPD